MIVVRRAKNVDLLAQNVVAVRIQCWNYSQESICFSDGKFSATRNSETGAEEYTIPASKQRLWIATQVPCLSVLRQLVRENP